MGRIVNAVAGTIGTAVVTANSFFAGARDDLIASNDSAYINSNAVGTEAVLNIGSAPTAEIEARDYLADLNEAVETAVEDSVKHDDREETVETSHDTAVDEMTTGSAPPNDNNTDVNNETSLLDVEDIYESAETTDLSMDSQVDYSNDLSDFGSENISYDSYEDSSFSNYSDDLSFGEDDGISI